MKQIYSFILSFLITVCAFAQPQPFSKIFGDSNLPEQGAGVIQLSSGNIIMAGTADIDSIGGFDLSLSKFDASGNLLWQKYYGTLQSDFTNGLLQVDEKTLAISGSTTDPSLRNDALVLLVDTAGQEQWLKVYSDTVRSSYFKTMLTTNDGNLVASGGIAGSSGFGNDSYIVKMNLQGDIIWTSTLRDSAIDIAHATVNTLDGGYMVAGDIQRPGGHYNLYAAKLDPSGEVVWKKTFENINNGGSQNLIPTSDGNYLITGESYPDTTEPYFDIYLLKIKPNGEIIWDSYIGDPLAEAGYKIFEAQPGIFIGAGYGFNFTGNSTDIIVTRVDSNGNEIDRKYFGNQFTDQGFDIAPSVFGEFGFVATGFSVLGPDDQYILVYDSFPPFQTDAIETVDNEVVNLYPNPIRSNETFTIDLPTEKVDWQILDLQGRIIKHFQTNAHQQKIILKADFLPGYYFLQGQSKTIFYRNRLSILE